MRFALTALCAFAMLSTKAYAGDFVDTRISFNMTHENMLVKPGETSPSIPGFRFGAPQSAYILFYDNYDTRFTGYENLTHLALYKKWDRGRLVMEAAYVIRILSFTDVNLSQIDDGSYIKGTFYFDRNWKEEGGRKLNLSFTLFPLSADRMRLGYSYRLSWGGSPIFFKFNPDVSSGSSTFITNTQPAPGAKLQLADDRWYAYVGFKTSTFLDKSINEQAVVYGLLAGVGVDVIKDHFRIEANGGYFNRGVNQRIVVAGGRDDQAAGVALETFGGTLQLSVFNGIAPTTSLDLRLYRNDPTSLDRYFKRPEYGGGLRWLISTEWTGLGSTLQDPDAPGSTKIQPSYAGDVNFRMQVGKFRLRADFAMRSLSFILINQPSLVPSQDLPTGSEVGDELFGALGLDYFFERIGFTAGVSGGVMRPATFTPPNNDLLPPPITGNIGGSLSTRTTLVVRNEGDYSILPEGQREVPIVAARLDLREDFLEYFAIIAQLYYQYDPNQTILTKAGDGTSLRNFNYPHRLGINVAVQAKF